MAQQSDVLIIGGGVAGVAAALEAAAGGAAVVVVRAGPGATSLSSGAWVGPLPPLVAGALSDSGLRYVPATDALPHPFGGLRRADFAAETHASAGIGDASCVCGIAGLPGFPASALARMWGAARHVTVRLPHTPAGGWSPVALAAELERDPDPLAAELGKLGAGTRAILPAVLGLDPAASLAAGLAAAAGIEVGEALGVPPSLPGWRLDLALLRALERAGIALVPGRVVARRASGTRLEAVTVERGSGERAELAADRFVLATGRFVGGGIIASAAAERVDVARGQAMREAELLERALGCDVWVEHLGDRFAQVQPVALTDPVRREPQALLRAGVHLDELGRPVDVQDRLLFENLVARGVVIAETSHGLGYAAGGVAA